LAVALVHLDGGDGGGETAGCERRVLVVDGQRRQIGRRKPRRQGAASGTAHVGVEGELSQPGIGGGGRPTVGGHVGLEGDDLRVDAGVLSQRLVVACDETLQGGAVLGDLLLELGRLGLVGADLGLLGTSRRRPGR
jgi:hypothetical protein